MLHIHCGDSSADQQRRADLPGQVIVWCDPLCEGPTPAGLSREDWRRVRAEYLIAATGGAFTVESNLAWQQRQDTALATWADHDEIVLWFDACLYDQTILAHHLDYFSRQELGPRQLTLISAATFPGRPTFKGLGELSTVELASLFPSRSPVTPDQLALGRRAWEAHGASDPTALQQLLGEPEANLLPHLRDAMHRHLEQFPWTGDGLDRLQRQALQAVAAGHRRLGDLFAAVSAMEKRPFFGDTTLWGLLDDLATCPRPLLSVDDGRPLPRWEPPAGTTGRSVSLTASGQEVLAGRADQLAFNPIDRWLGGVHLQGATPAWRWDGRSQRLACT